MYSPQKIKLNVQASISKTEAVPSVGGRKMKIQNSSFFHMMSDKSDGDYDHKFCRQGKHKQHTAYKCMP